MAEVWALAASLPASGNTDTTVYFVISDDGVVVSACRYLDAVASDVVLPYGTASRHLAAASISQVTESVAIVVSESSMVRIFDDGRLVAEIIPELWVMDHYNVQLFGALQGRASGSAINEAGINHYLLKPWDPPEENLYPVLDGLLEDWQAAFPPQFEGIRVLGNRWSPTSHNIKDFLARNHVPYQWLDVETTETDAEVSGRRRLAGRGRNKKLAACDLS